MGFKLFVSIWLVSIALNPQEIQCLDSDNSPWDNCWTWTKWSRSDNAFDNWNTNSKVVSLNDTTKPFGMGCHVSNSYITHIGKSSVPEANCILTHTHQGLVGKSYTNCIASENGTPCTEDKRIMFEKKPMETARWKYICMVTFLYFKNEDLGKWTMVQDHQVEEFEVTTF